MTNAKNTIIKKAEELITLLVEKERVRLTELRNDYYKFLETHPITESKSFVRAKGEYTHYERMRHFSLKECGCEDFTNSREFYNYSSAFKINGELNIATNDKSFANYLEEYATANRVKLVRAIEKYITEDMKVIGGVNVDQGVKGVEVSAKVSTPEGKRLFKTRAIFAGGYIQRYHYRYRGGLVMV